MDETNGNSSRPTINEEDERFEQAVKICGDDFMSVLTTIVESDLPARQYVEQALKDAGKIRTEGKEYVVQNGDVMLVRFNV